MKLVIFLLILFFSAGYSYSQSESEELGRKLFGEEIPPVALNLSEVRKSIQYPDSARKQEIEGRVTIKVLVDKDGNIEKVGDFTGDPVFREEIQRVISNLKFTPGSIGGEPIRCWVTVPFTFKLNREKTPPANENSR